MALPDSKEVERLVELELAKFRDAKLRQSVTRFLVAPSLQIRLWKSERDSIEVPCWIVADFQERDVGVIFTKHGHGRSGYFWNLAFLHDNYLDTGNNSCYRTLEDLVIDSGYFDS